MLTPRSPPQSTSVSHFAIRSGTRFRATSFQRYLQLLQNAEEHLLKIHGEMVSDRNQEKAKFPGSEKVPAAVVAAPDYVQDEPVPPQVDVEAQQDLEVDSVPDGGREAWLVVLGSSLALFVSAGMVNAYVSGKHHSVLSILHADLASRVHSKVITSLRSCLRRLPRPYPS